MQCQFANKLHEQNFVSSFGRSNKWIQQYMTGQETRNKPCGQVRLRVAQAAHISTGGSSKPSRWAPMLSILVRPSTRTPR